MRMLARLCLALAGISLLIITLSLDGLRQSASATYWIVTGDDPYPSVALRQNIALMAADGSFSQQVIATDALDFRPTIYWSPDAQWLVVADNHRSLYGVHVSGSPGRRITPQHAFIEQVYVLEEDPDWLYYVAQNTDRLRWTYRVRFDGSQHEPLSDFATYADTPTGTNRPANGLFTVNLSSKVEVLFALPGGWLIVASDWGTSRQRLHRVRLDGSDMIPLSTSGESHPAYNRTAGGRWLYVTVRHTGTDELLRVDTRDFRTTSLLEYRYINTVLFTPDQEWLIVRAYDGADHRFLAMPVDGTSARQLFALPADNHLLGTFITPDNRWLAISYAKAGPAPGPVHLVKVRLADGHVEALPDGRVLSFSPTISFDWHHRRLLLAALIGLLPLFPPYLKRLFKAVKPQIFRLGRIRP